MARSVTVDHAQNYRFRAVMVEEGGQAAVALGALQSAATSIFGGAFGSFSRISIPSTNIETEEFKEGVWPFRRRAIVGASLDTVLMERGVTMLDSSFWTWAMAAITGDASRKMLIIELMHRAKPNLPILSSIRNGNILGSSSGGRSLGVTANTAPNVQATVLTATISPELPVVAKRWVLHECIPVRVKPASDLDATNAEVSIAELEVHANWMEQIPFTAV